MNVVARRFIEDNPELVSTTEVVIAIGKLICNFPPSDRKRILHSGSVFLEASRVFNQIEGCPTDCLIDLAQFATQFDAFGDPVTWTADDFADLGPVIAGRWHAFSIPIIVIPSEMLYLPVWSEFILSLLSRYFIPT